MKRLPGLVLAFFSVLALTVGFAGSRAHADPIVYDYPALPGPVANCKWFDDNINNHSLASIIRQTDLIYNLKALAAGQNVAVSGTATTELGGQLVQFDLDRRLLCVTAEAINPTLPAPTPTPPQL